MKEEMMKKTIFFGIILSIFCMMSMPTAAGDFDGSKELTCTCMRVIECRPDGQCKEVTAEDLG